MELKNYFNINDIIHPNTYYYGDWNIGGNNTFLREDSLVVNAKVVNKENLYMKFLDKYYYNELASILDSVSLSHGTEPKILSRLTDDKSKRVLTFSLVNYFIIMVDSLLFTKFNEEEVPELDNNDKILDKLKELLKSDRKCYFDIKNNGSKSVYYDKLVESYKGFLEFNKDVSFNKFMESVENGYTKRIIANKYLKQFFDKEINLDELIKCFDYDKLALILSKSALEQCEYLLETENKVGNCILATLSYLDAVKKLRKDNPKYNTSIYWYDKNDEIFKSYNIDDLEKRVNEILKNHPEFSYYSLSLEEIKVLLKDAGYSDEYINNFNPNSKDMDLVTTLLDNLKKDKELAANWEFIPKGEIDNSNDSINNNGYIVGNNKVSIDERNRRIVISKQYLDNSKYLYTCIGLDKFDGYVGYIYPNKMVVFERFYEDYETKEPAKQRATYVMNLENFRELSHLSKIDIINGLRKGTINGVKRIYHTEDMDRWKKSIERYVSGNDYNDEVINYINGLITKGSLSRRNSKEV